MKKKLITSLFISSLLLGACGADETPTQEPTPVEPAVEEELEEVEEEIVEVEDTELDDFTTFITDNGFELGELYGELSYQLSEVNSSEKWVIDTLDILISMRNNAVEAIEYDEVPDIFAEDYEKYVEGSELIIEGVAMAGSSDDIEPGLQLTIDGGDLRNQAVAQMTDKIKAIME